MCQKKWAEKKDLLENSTPCSSMQATPHPVDGVVEDAAADLVLRGGGGGRRAEQQRKGQRLFMSVTAKSTRCSLPLHAAAVPFSAQQPLERAGSVSRPDEATTSFGGKQASNRGKQRQRSWAGAAVALRRMNAEQSRRAWL